MATLPLKDCVLVGSNELFPNLVPHIIDFIREELNSQAIYYTRRLTLPRDSDKESPTQAELRESFIESWIDHIVMTGGPPDNPEQLPVSGVWCLMDLTKP